MDSAFVSILSAVIGAAAGIVGGGLSGQRQARLEREKWFRGVSDAFTIELRSSVKELTTKLAEATHSMCWLCWSASFGAERLTQERVAQYDNEMHVLLPQITGLHAVIAGMDYAVYLKLKPLIEQLLKLDAMIGDAGLDFVPNEPKSANRLAELLKQATSLERTVSEVVADAIRPYSIARTLTLTAMEPR
jgi:hypothetical protein